MKVFVTPRLDAVHLTSYFRARAAARLARAVDRAAAVRVEREDPQTCDRIHHADDDAESTHTSFWILHAR
jgi:hypothetical protein